MGDDLPILAGLLVLAAFAWGISSSARAWRRSHPPTPPVIGLAEASKALVWSPGPDSAHSRKNGNQPPGLSPPLPGWAGLLLGSPLDLNTASLEDLDALPGVGPSTALEILRTRRDLGAFRQSEDLLSVRGIGQKTLERLRPWVSTDRQPRP